MFKTFVPVLTGHSSFKVIWRVHVMFMPHRLS